MLTSRVCPAPKVIGVRCNHVHLLLWARRGGDVAAAMHFLQGNAARDYNRRKGRQGAFWGGRYHRTLIESGRHLSRCLFYIDMNMVRAGAVARPEEWDACGCRELAQDGSRRRAVIDRDRLLDCLEFDGRWGAFSDWHRRTLAELVSAGWRVREPVWSTAAAIGTRPFLDRLAGGLRGAEVREMPAPDTTAGSVALGEGDAVYALHLSERTRRLFWEDRQ